MKYQICHVSIFFFSTFQGLRWNHQFFEATQIEFVLHLLKHELFSAAGNLFEIIGESYRPNLDL